MLPRWIDGPAILTTTFLGFLLSLPNPVEGQDVQVCDSGVVSQIEIRRANVFDLERVDPDARSYRIYGVANRFHVMTRESVVRNELLFEEGDCLDDFLIQESVRALRGLVFINQVTAEVEALEDGSSRVVIRTQDDWTLEVSLGISIDEGFTIEGLGVVERNFLGTGTTLGVVRREDLESLEQGLVGGIPRLPRTPLDATGELGWTRTGWYGDQSVRLPFRVETNHLAVRERTNFRNDVFRYNATAAQDFRYALIPFDLKDGDVAVQYRLGKPGGFWLLGGGVGWEDWVFPGYPETVQEVEGRDFDTGTPAAPETAVELLGQTYAQSSLRMNLALGYRSMRFTQRRGLDAVDAEQDVPVGFEILISGGKSVGAFGRNPIDDAKSRAYAYYGADWGRFVLGSELDIEGRSVDLPTGEREWRDVLAEADIYLYTVLNEDHTIVTRASTARGLNMSRPFQLALGGRGGVRGYSRDAFPGAESVVFSVEERWLLDWPNSEAADISFTFFGDAGRMAAGDVPFGVDSGWRASVGVGLRFGFPSGAPGGRRLEFTYPLTGDREQAVYFRYYEDVTGLLLGFADALMNRSRWGGFRPNLSR